MERILEARILSFTNEMSVAEVISSRAEERIGDVARFAPVVGGNVKDYAGEIKWDDIKAEPVELTLANKKYVADKINDVEALRTNKERVDRFSRAQASELVYVEDKTFLGELAKSAGKSIQRTIGTPEQAYEALVDANKELSKAGVPQHDRFLVVDYDLLGMLEKDARFTKYDEILANGIVQGTNINGATLVVTTNLPENTVLAVQKDGVGFERFLDKVEIMRLESDFADGFRAISVFDGKVIEKDHVVKVTTKEPATK